MDTGETTCHILSKWDSYILLGSQQLNWRSTANTSQRRLLTFRLSLFRSYIRCTAESHMCSCMHHLPISSLLLLPILKRRTYSLPIWGTWIVWQLLGISVCFSPQQTNVNGLFWVSCGWEGSNWCQDLGALLFVLLGKTNDTWIELKYKGSPMTWSFWLNNSAVIVNNNSADVIHPVSRIIVTLTDLQFNRRNNSVL